MGNAVLEIGVVNGIRLGIGLRCSFEPSDVVVGIGKECVAKSGNLLLSGNPDATIVEAGNIHPAEQFIGQSAFSHHETAVEQ